MEKIVIRPVHARDAALIVNWTSALAEVDGEASSFGKPDFKRDVLGENPAVHMWLAEVDRAPAGFVSAYPGYDLHTASRGWHLGDVFVGAQFRRRGVGKALLRFLAKQVRASGGVWLAWTVSQANEPACAFYETLCAHRMPVHFMALGKSGMDGL